MVAAAAGLKIMTYLLDVGSPPDGDIKDFCFLFFFCGEMPPKESDSHAVVV